MNSNTFSIKPTNIYVYLRVSTQAQTYKTNGLDEQNKVCQKYIKDMFSKFKGSIEFYTDIASSYNNKNTLINLNKITRKLSSTPNSLLLVRDISRLGRDTFQVFSLLRKIKKTNSFIIGIEENLCYNYTKLMDRKFSHAIIDSEEHSDTKSIGTKNRINKIISVGGYVGRVPYGTKIIKKNNIPYIYKNPNEINILKMIKSLFLKYKCVIKTTKYLNTHNFKYRNNVDWTETQIKKKINKFFPNLLLNKKSDIIDNYFIKYKDYTYEFDKNKK
jgi:DNA invertase Pin-like site-specific DNA recombinase